MLEFNSDEQYYITVQPKLEKGFEYPMFTIIRTDLISLILRESAALSRATPLEIDSRLVELKSFVFYDSLTFRVLLLQKLALHAKFLLATELHCAV